MTSYPLNSKIITFLENELDETSMKVLLVLLKEKREMLDEEIAEKINEKVTKIRSALNVLYEKGLIKYRREKPGELNWFHYFWSIDEEKAKSNLKKNIEKKIEKYKEIIEKNEVKYTCKHNCGFFSFDEALENNFVCPVCGSPLDVEIHPEEIFKKEIEKLEKMLKEFSEKTKKRRKTRKRR